MKTWVNFFSTQPQCLLTFSWNELQILLRCCLIHLSIIMMKHVLYLVYLGLSLFMSHLCDLFSIFIFIIINHIISLKRYTFFRYILKYALILLNNMNEGSEYFSKGERSASGCFLSFALFFIDVSLVLLLQKQPSELFYVKRCS